VGVVAGFLAILSGESVFYSLYLSDPLYHLHALDHHNQMPSATVWFWNPETPWSGGLVGRLLRDGPTVIFLNTEFGLFTVAALLAIAYGFYRKTRWPWFVGTWFVYHVLIFNFGFHSLRAYIPLPAWERRYFYPLLLPATLLVAWLLDMLLRPVEATEHRPTERMFWGAALGVILLLGCAHGLPRSQREGRELRREDRCPHRSRGDAALYRRSVGLATALLPIVPDPVCCRRLPGCRRVIFPQAPISSSIQRGWR